MEIAPSRCTCARVRTLLVGRLDAVRREALRRANRLRFGAASNLLARGYVARCVVVREKIQARAAQAGVELTAITSRCTLSAAEAREKILTEASELGLTTRQVLERWHEGNLANVRTPKRLTAYDVTMHLWPETVERFKTWQTGRATHDWFFSRAIEDWLRIKGRGDASRADLTTNDRRAPCAMGSRRAFAICAARSPHLEGRKICEHCRETRNLLERLSSGRKNSGSTGGGDMPQLWQKQRH